MPEQSSHILSVTDLTAAIRNKLEGSFPFVWVRGQVANLSRPASGHVYFSLRDEESSLAAVWFRGSQKEGERFDPLTGEVYEGGPKPCLALSLENGQELVCAGRIAVYGARGQYQLVVEFAQDAGLGRLHEEFDRLRVKLAGLGYFAAERKRPLPEQPTRIALITSPKGAAIHDFLRLSEQRGLSSAIRVYPVQVQGEAASPAIIAALGRINNEAWAEVAVLIRGGGSLEDLWAFNDEGLARAIFSSAVPVLAGIGHEVDFTLADMTADVRAATPSHAAQLLWPERETFFRRLRVLREALLMAEDRYFEGRGQHLASALRSLAMLSPARRIDDRGERLRSLVRLLRGAGDFALERRETRLQGLSRSLRAAPERLPARQNALATLESRLTAAGGRSLERAGHEFERLLLRLEGLDPHAPLKRGYALARKADGSFVRLKEDVAAGEALSILVSNGEIPVRVEGANE